MKKYILVSSLTVLSLVACSDSDTSSIYQEKEYQRQVEIYNEQARRTTEQQTETERQIKLSEAQQKRMEKLLQRWEKQADRYDVILDKWEKQK